MIVAILLSTAAMHSDTTSGDPRESSSRLLRAALIEAEAHGHTCEPGFSDLVEAGRGASEELDGSSFGASLREIVQDARWRAVTDPDAAQVQLTQELERAADDLGFEPLIEADLPEGFPDPTPVREIQLKEYPRYRMVRAGMSGSRSDGAFWKLFRHIQQNEIAMTAPVETTYATVSDELNETRMAFLYGSPELGEAGHDGEVEVVDAKPSTVVSIGCRGAMTPDAIDEARDLLLRWVEERGDLEFAGEVRTMGYNSPMVATARRFFEVQIPVSSAAAASRSALVIDFGDKDEVRRWGPVDDAVMGGVSSSRFVWTDRGSCVFTGNVSLENNGGFASVRSSAADLGLEGAEALRLTFRGDGKSYKLRLRTTGDFDGVSYQVAFPTEAGVWMERTFAIDEFVPVWRGRVVRDAPELDPGQVRSVGFLISDEQVGEFHLELASLSKE